MRPRILVVDDEPDVLEATVLGLAHFTGAQVEGAASAEEARERIVSGRYDYDLVLTDERMPSMSGSELLRWLAEASPRTLRVLMTAYVGDGMADRLVAAAPVDALVRKPFAIADAAATLTGLLGSARGAESPHASGTLRR